MVHVYILKPGNNTQLHFSFPLLVTWPYLVFITAFSCYPCQIPSALKHAPLLVVIPCLGQESTSSLTSFERGLVISSPAVMGCCGVSLAIQGIDRFREGLQGIACIPDTLLLTPHV